MLPFDPATVPLHTLPSLAFVARKDLPNCPALYFVLDAAARILYIGQSRRLAYRWLHHHKATWLQEHGAGTIAWVAVDDPALLPQIERACIAYFRPPGNHVAPPQWDGPSVKLQVFLPSRLRRQLKSLAHEKNTSLQKLVVALLTVGTEDAAATVLPAVDRHLAQPDASAADTPNRHLIRGEVIAGQ